MAPSRRARLSADEIARGLPEDWQGDERQIWREFRFEHYMDGVNFALNIARLADAEDHHPELHILYRAVRVVYWTHDRGGVTALDLSAAQAVSDLYQTRKPDQ